MTLQMKTLEAGAGARIKGVQDIKLLEELHSHVETLKVQVSELSVRKNQLAREIKQKENQLSSTLSKLSELQNTQPVTERVTQYATTDNRSPKKNHKPDMVNRGTNTGVRCKDASVQNCLNHEDDLMLERTLRQNLRMDEQNSNLRQQIDELVWQRNQQDDLISQLKRQMANLSNDNEQLERKLLQHKAAFKMMDEK